MNPAVNGDHGPRRFAANPRQRFSSVSSPYCLPAVNAVPGSQTIWIIDDSATIRAIVAHHLMRRGLHVQAFANGHDALDRLMHLHHAQAEQPRLILLDRQLPDLDGLDVARSIRHVLSASRTAIVLVSGQHEALDRVVCPLAGIDGSLRKPFDCSTLLQVISRFLPALSWKERLT
ncbi:MAG TPA: response regulator [Ktedonobacteraceae bacterium]|nr:response regulator [Ktedonobacteraceae bacterium]